jgi:hypothetical protein
MNRSALLLGVGAGLLFAAGTANAGACSAEIEALQKTIASIGTVAGGATDQPNANAASQAEGSTDTGTPGGTVPAPGEIPVPAAKTGQTAAAGTEPVPAPNGTDATGGMVADAGSGIAPGKVEDPKSSDGTLAQSGGAGGVPAETGPQDSVVPQAGQPTSAATGAQPDPDAASQSLARAQLLDQAGDEPGCMKEVGQAKSQLGQL